MPKYRTLEHSILLAPVDIGRLESLLREYEIPNGFSSEVKIEPFNSMLLVTIKVPSFAITGLRAALYNINKKGGER